MDLTPAARSIATILNAAGDMPLGGSTLAQVYGRQIVATVDSGQVVALTQSARVALASAPRLDALVHGYSGIIDAGRGAGLRAVAITDSPAGYAAAEIVAMVDGMYDVSKQSPAAIRTTAELVRGLVEPKATSAAHTVPSAADGGASGWINLGPSVSSDVRYFTGVSNELSEWPERIRDAGRGSIEQAKAGSLAARTLAHEAHHLQIPLGGKVPGWLGEAHADYVSALSDQPVRIAELLGIDPGPTAVRNSFDAATYDDEVRRLAVILDDHGITPDRAGREAWLRARTTDDLEVEFLGGPAVRG